MKPYIGITDFKSPDQVRSMLEILKKHRKPISSRMLHVGTMMSYSTLNGIDSKYSGIFPANKDLAGIFIEDPTHSIYNCLHYADYARDRTKAVDIVRAIQYSGPNLHSIQLDMTWPSEMMIARAMRTHPHIEVILQVGNDAFEACRYDPRWLVNRLSYYESIIDRVLLDLSMGRGIPIDSEKISPFIDLIEEELPQIGIGVAGGLGPGKRNLIQQLTDVRNYISIDAQSKLRASGNLKDPIDWDLARQYLKEFLPILG